MGVFKQLKDMKQVVAQAPGMVEQAQKMAQQAQQLQAAQMAAAQAQPGQAAGAPAGGVDPALLEPIAGISLERYAQLARSIGERKLDQAGVESFVKLQGHSPEEWQAAYDGWNARFKNNMALSVHFGSLYQQARSL
ncbi:MAG: hypothetical protein H6Q11_200 [Acidobacteria bacterium]|nr:hypothetical protein [Acidobacteriota bacterium]